VLSPCQSHIYTLVIWDKPAFCRPYCGDQNKFILSPLWLIDRQHLDVFVLFDRILELSPLGGIKSDNGQIFRLKVHGLWFRRGLHLLEPKGQKLLNRFALRVIFERGADRPLLPVNVDEDERIFRVEETFVRRSDIACFYFVIVEMIIRHVYQSLVHSVLYIQSTLNCIWIAK